MITDEILVTKVLNGERSAFDILINKYQGIIYNYIFKMTINKEDSEDIIQEVFIKAYENLYKLENRDKFYSWLFKITINTMNSYFRNRKHFTYVEDNLLINIHCNKKDTPEEFVQIKDENKQLLKRLSILNDEQKNAIILKYIQGFSYKEIGIILGIKEETVKTKIFRAKKKLHENNYINELRERCV